MRSKRNYKVLIVDGSLKVREALEFLFCNRFGCQKVHLSNNGSEAWEIIKKSAIDLIICNRHIKGISGFELLLKLRESKRYQHLPFLLVFNKEDQEEALKATHLGATDSIAKPFTPRDFVLKIRKILYSEDRRADERYEVPFESKVTVVDPTTGSLTGKVVNVGMNGILAQLKFSRNLAVYDRVDIRLQFLMTRPENMAKTLQGRVIRVEWNPRSKAHQTAYYAFEFAMLRKDQKAFLRELIEMVEVPVPEMIV